MDAPRVGALVGPSAAVAVRSSLSGADLSGADACSCEPPDDGAATVAANAWMMVVRSFGSAGTARPAYRNGVGRRRSGQELVASAARPAPSARLRRVV